MKKIFLIAVMAILTFSAYAQNQKFAHVNYNELVTLMPEADVAREKLAAQSKEFEQTYQDADIKESKEKELNDIQTRLQEFQQTAQGELQQQQQELMAPIYKKAQDVVGKLAKEGGYIYVFEKTSLLYVDEAQSKDLTAAARKALNIPDSRTMESLQAELQSQQQAVQK